MEIILVDEIDGWSKFRMTKFKYLHIKIKIIRFLISFFGSYQLIYMYITQLKFSKFGNNMFNFSKDLEKI